MCSLERGSLKKGRQKVDIKIEVNIYVALKVK